MRFSVTVPPADPGHVDEVDGQPFYREGLRERFDDSQPAGPTPLAQAATNIEWAYEIWYAAHTRRRHVLVAPEVTVNALDVAVKPNLKVGYVMGVGDEVPQALEQLGAAVVLAPTIWRGSDLGKFDVIMTGVRAHERRSDLRAYNQRLSISPARRDRDCPA